MKENARRLWSLLMVIMMMVTMLPTDVLADEPQAISGPVSLGDAPYEIRGTGQLNEAAYSGQSDEVKSDYSLTNTRQTDEYGSFIYRAFAVSDAKLLKIIESAVALKGKVTVSGNGGTMLTNTMDENGVIQLTDDEAKASINGLSGTVTVAYMDTAFTNNLKDKITAIENNDTENDKYGDGVIYTASASMHFEYELDADDLSYVDASGYVHYRDKWYFEATEACLKLVTDQSGTVTTKDGTACGTYTVNKDTGRIEIDFYDDWLAERAANDGLDGQFNLSGDIDRSQITTTEPYTIIHVGDGDIIVYPDGVPGDITVTKAAESVVTDEETGKASITWKVTVTSKTGTYGENGIVITDKLPASLNEPTSALLTAGRSRAGASATTR